MERQDAEKRVDELLGWFTHLTIYFSVLALLAAINTLTWRGVPWVLFAAFGWGFGLIFHGLRVGAFRLGRLEQWRQAKIDELMRSS